VNADWLNRNERMMVIRGPSTNQSLLTYRVTGLRSGTVAQVRITGYSLSSAACPAGFRFIVNGNAEGTSGTSTDLAAPPATGQFVRTVNVTVPAGTDGFTFDLRSSYTGFGSCVLGISKIEIIGCLNIKISTLEGDEVCEGELIRLWTDKNYYATTYRWEKSVNNGAWAVIGGNVRSVADEITAPTRYRVTVDGTLSEVLTVSTKLCCEIRPGVGGSQRTIFHETFGTFQGPTTYTDAWGNRYERNLNPPLIVGGMPHTAARGWKVNLPPGMMPHHPPCWDCTSDGYYIIATAVQGVLALCGGWNMTPYGADASGDPLGGVLAINVGGNPPVLLYERRIDNLCPDIDLDFEASVADGTQVGNINFEVRLERTDGTLLGSRRARSAGATGNDIVMPRSGWVRVRIPSFRTNESSVVLKVVSNIGAASGNDILIDDIIFRICVPPIVELYTNLETLEQNTTICDRHNVYLSTQIGELVRRYYNNDPRLLYQFSTNNGATWSNIGGMTTNEELVHPLAAFAPMAGTGNPVLFRIVVASPDLLSAFITNPNSQGNTNCKTVSVSDPIRITIDCPCPTPGQNRFSINATKPISNRVIAMCDEETVTLSVQNFQNVAALWFESNTQPTVGATPIHTGNSFPVTVSGIGTRTFWVRLIEADMPSAQQCWRHDYVTLRVDPAPANNILTDVCISDNPTAPTADDQICFRFTSNYANGLLNAGDPVESTFRPFRSLTGGSPIGPNIVVPARAEGLVCFPGNQVEVRVTQGVDTLYHVYLEDITVVTKTGVLMDGEGVDMIESTDNDNQQGSRVNAARLQIRVDQPITLKDLTLHARRTSGNASITITPIIYNSAGTALTPALAATTSQSFGATVVPIVVNLHDRVLQPGTYFIGFTFGGTMTNVRLRFGTSPSNNGTFTQRFEDNLAESVLFGTGARMVTANSDRYLISNLTFTTQMQADNCDRVRLTNMYFCPTCARPDVQDGKRVNIIVPSSAVTVNDTIVVLCNDGNVNFSITPLRFGNAQANNEFNVSWHEGSKTAAAQNSTNASTSNFIVNAWTLPNPNVAETKKFYVRARSSIAPDDVDCWMWDSIYVRVNPTPSITNTPLIEDVCSGGDRNSVVLTSNVTTDVNYSWTSSVTGAITGNTPSGEGDLPGETLTSSGSTSGTVTYRITPRVGECSGDPVNYVVTVNPKPSITDRTATICSGGRFTVTPLPSDGGSNVIPAGTTYTWIVAANANVEGQSAQTSPQTEIAQELTNRTNEPQIVIYTVTPQVGTAPNICTGETFTVTVTVNPKPFITPQTDAICSGGTFTITPANGGGNIVPDGTLYTWVIASADAAVTGQSAQATPQATISQTLTSTSNEPQTVTYTVTPHWGTAPNACPGETFTVTITVNPTPVVENQTADPICSGETFTVTPANGGYNIIPAGTLYTWIVADNANVEGQSAQTTAQTNISQTLTNRSNTVQTVIYTVTPQVGTAPDICTGETFTVTVTVNPKPFITPQTDAICSSETFTITPANGGGNIVPSGTTYTWTVASADAEITGQSDQPVPQPNISQTLESSSNAARFVVYNVTPHSDVCPGDAFTATVTVASAPSIIDQTAVICSGETFTVAPADGGDNIVPPGTNYIWVVSAANAEITGASNQATAQLSISQTLTNRSNTVQTVTYTVTPRLGLTCLGEPFELTVTVNPTPTVTGLVNQTRCNGIATNAVNFTGNMESGVNYSWVNNRPVIGLQAIGNGDIASFLAVNITNEPIVATITVTPESTAGCVGNQASFTITVNPTPTVNALTNQSVCNGALTTAVNFEGNMTDAVTYSWINSHPAIGLPATGNTDIASFAATNTTNEPIIATITVTPTAIGCSGTPESFTIRVNPTPVVEIDNNTDKTELTCTTPSISLTATGGATYSWSGGLGNNANATVTAEGTYIVTATDANNCSATASITITEDKVLPIAGITNNSLTNVLTCTTPSISLTATGDGTYSWNNGLSDEATVTVTERGTYTVTVTAANGCPNTASIEITQDDSQPTAGITTNTGTQVLTCATPSIILIASGGVSYSWDNDLGNSANATVILDGTYTVTVTAANGCTATASIPITEDKILPTITVNHPETCLGGSVTITASGADSYTWMETGETEDNITFIPTASTTRKVTGMIDATGCTNTATANVYVETPVGLTLSAPRRVELGNELRIIINAERTDHGYFDWFLNHQPHETTAGYDLTLVPDAGRHHFRVQTITTYMECPSSTEIFVEVTEFVPNAFNPYSPGGKNAHFMRGYRVEIFNRYMQKVYEGGDGWDGTYRGALAEPGTYFYLLYKKSGQVEKGTVEVARF
jgi:cytochrome c oxidase assembly protein Cox11